MKHLKLFATVSGKTCEGEDFTEGLTFTLIPPAEGSEYYGTGYYMRVDVSTGRHHYIDVRYERTTDIEKLADGFIKGWYGKNAQEVKKWAPRPDLVSMPGAEKLADLKVQYSK